MNRTDRQAAKENAERRKAAARAAAMSVRAEDREAALARALVRPDLDPRQRVARLVARSGQAAPVRTFLEIVADRAPRLLDGAYARAIDVIAEQPRLRPIEAWEPEGKGRERLYRSLASHLFAAFPMPAVLWTGFLEDRALWPLVLWVASGGSLVELVKARFPIPLSRKQCHLVLDARGASSLLATIRRVQVLAHGGDPRVADAWAATGHTRGIGTREEETFLASVAEWLAGRAIAPASVGPLVDFVVARHAEDPTYSLKGRTPASLAAATARWHEELAQAKLFAQLNFRPSGLRPLTLRGEENGRVITWRVEELLTSRELVEEGRRMNHCVASYARMVASGAISIWVMTLEDGTGPTGRWAQLTIEVRHALRAIVQARGRFNRLPLPRERAVLARWAAMNALTMSG